MDENKNGYSWISTTSDDFSFPQHSVLAGYDADGAEIYVGRSYHANHFLPAKVIPSKKIAYISYAGDEIPKDHFEILCGTTFEWVACADGHVPDGAVCTGNQSDGEPVYVGRAHFRNSLIPGKVHRSHNRLYIPFDGIEHSICEYEVLTEKMMKTCHWISLVSHEPIPDDAIVAGYDIDETPLYVGRAYHQRDQIPGKYVPNHHVVYVPYDGEEHAKQQFEILCNGNVSWVDAAYGSVPSNAVVGGKTIDGETLYIGRAYFEGSLTPGKIHPSHRTLYISFDGSEIGIEEYQVMVEN